MAYKITIPSSSHDACIIQIEGDPEYPAVWVYGMTELYLNDGTSILISPPEKGQKGSMWEGHAVNAGTRYLGKRYRSIELRTAPEAPTRITAITRS